MRTLIVLFLFALLMPGRPEAGTTELSQATCEEILGSTLADDLAERDKVNCETAATAVTHVTGIAPFWTGCLGWNEMGREAHAARCLLMSALTRNSAPETGCEQLRARYERGLQAASPNSELPGEYAHGCDLLDTAALTWQTSRSDWLRCQGYTRKAELAHMANCIAEDLRDRAGKRVDCATLRGLYESRLVAALGALPAPYRPTPCPKLDRIISDLDALADKAEAERRVAASIAAEIRSKAAEMRSERAAVGLAIMIGALVAAGAAGGVDTSGVPPTFGPGSASCMSGAALFDGDISMLLGC